jgi:hypothetical protein
MQKVNKSIFFYKFTYSPQMTVLENATSFEKFQLQISEDSLYSENSVVIDQVLRDMSSLPFKSVDMKEGGTQLKLVIDFQGGGKALYKPMRFQRNQTVSSICMTLFLTLNEHFIM